MYNLRDRKIIKRGKLQLTHQHEARLDNSLNKYVRLITASFSLLLSILWICNQA